MLWKVTAVAVAAMIVASGFAVAYFRANYAITCVSASLAARNGPLNRDRVASRAFASSLTRFEHVAADKSASERKRDAAWREFTADSQAWQDALSADIRAGRSHPLGEC